MNHEPLIARRGFLRAVSTTTAAVAATSVLNACAATASATSTPSPAPRTAGAWDMSWTDRVNGKYRVVFNVTQSANGMAFGQATSWLDGHVQAHAATDADLNLVMVFRHEAVRMVLNDAVWARLAPSGARAEFRTEMTRLASRGAIFLACNMALMGQASSLATKESISESDARAQIRAAVSPGVCVMPNGVFAVSRAQTAGCSYFQPG